MSFGSYLLNNRLIIYLLIINLFSFIYLFYLFLNNHLNANSFVDKINVR